MNMETPSANGNELTARFAAGVMTLTINRPAQRNALNSAVIEMLAENFREVAASEVRAIVVTGSGDRAFCAGADLASEDAFNADCSRPHSAYADLLRLARSIDVPIIGRINGSCMAGGMGLLAICDLCIAADHAVFGLPEVKVGLFPMQVLALLQSLIPRRHVAELCFTAKPITAERAREIGLINRVVPGDQLDESVSALLETILANSPMAIRRGKYAMTAIESMSAEQALAFMEGQLNLVLLTDDAREGIDAFKGRRQPVWRNK